MPAVILMITFFVYPVLQLLPKSVDDSSINRFLVHSFLIFDQWDQEQLPDEALYEAMFLDITSSDKRLLYGSSRRMLLAVAGWRALILKSYREFPKIESGPYKEAMIAIDKRWGDIRYWRSLGTMTEEITAGYFLKAVDLQLDGKRNIIAKPENRQIYLMLWGRTLKISLLVTLCCVLLGYPLAWLMAHSTQTVRGLILMCVLLPFTSSVLVSAFTGMILLQEQGMVNDTLVALGVLDDGNRLDMMYNFTGSVIVLTHSLLPFSVLPMYSVMKRISPNQMRAAQGLGASPPRAFMRVYLPLSMPGVSGGAVLIFIMAFGNYVVPEYVGGRVGRMIAGMVSGWDGGSAAIGIMMLVIILTILWIYHRITGSAGLKISPPKY
ncbi:MAG: putative spermidine/putrescine transport system permease protein [Gammaproteobacteria bacterium]|jgi:putative spermidine/putrescine transport system permease protein